jgi:Asp-tRNA(Asn)/Glu-tRNA(Gln) amidotransferase A subunit family amidase
MDKYVDI